MTPRRRVRPTRDAGFSLIELIVTMSIMSVVMMVVLGGIVQIYAATTRVDNTSVARDQLGTSFVRLDKEIRYANWLSTPGQVGTRWYLEYALPGGCRQLIYNSGVLTLAAWTLPGTTPGTPTTLATDLTLIGSTAPFTVHPANTKPYSSASPGSAGVGRNFTPDHGQVRLRFNAQSGKVTLPFDVIFTAQNTDRNTSPLSNCSNGRPTT
jgi:prepilin-type N-terminal cleavage/methylation domain-containing protein